MRNQINREKFGKAIEEGTKAGLKYPVDKIMENNKCKGRNQWNIHLGTIDIWCNDWVDCDLQHEEVP